MRHTSPKNPSPFPSLSPSPFPSPFLSPFLFLFLPLLASAQESVTFNYSGSVQTYTVPPCVNQLEVVLKGGAGGGTNGGNGSTVTATIDVFSGDVLEIRVGEEGECYLGGWNGGGNGANATPFASRSCGGGGASDIRVAPYNLGNRIAVAAGGGGMGGGTSDGDGGNGGCLTGSAGESTFGDGGGGGSAFGGGFGGAPWAGGGNGGANGTAGNGGAGGSDPCGSNAPGGGGGGGRFGGGGGGSDCVTFTSSVGGGGGGGGSSLTPTGGTCVAGNVTGNGSVTITPVGGVALSVSPTNPFFCEGGEVNIEVQGADTYEWFPATGLDNTDTGNVTASPDSTTTYTLYVTNPECSDSVDITVVVVPYPELTLTPDYPTTCNDEQAVITVSGANSYVWSPAAGLNTTVGSTVIATPEETTTYTVTGTTSTCSTDTTVTVSYAITVAQEAYFCEGGNYILPDGVVAETPGDYSSSLVSVAGCDSIILTELIQTPLWQLAQEVIVCQDDPYYLPDSTLVTESGTYVTVLPSVQAGCDSTITTVAEVIPTIYTNYAYDICEGQYVNIPGGGQADTTGIYEIVYTSAVTGCDSTAVFDITVNPIYEDELIEATLCSNEPYELPDGDLAEESGVFEFNLESVAGCDSNIILNLTLQPAYEIELWETICAGDSYTLPDGSTASSAGTYFFENVTTLGCDSNYTVNLAVQDIPFVSPNIAPSYCPELTTIPLDPQPPGGTLAGPFVVGNQLNHAAASSGNYEVTYTYFDPFGCGGSTTSEYIIPEPFDDLAFTPEIKCNRVVLTPNALSPDGLYTYAWSFDGDLVEVAAIADYPFMTTGTYSIELQLTDPYGCTYGVTQVEDLESEFDLANFYIPNVITPNRDGDNEILQFNGVANECLRYELQIFNRWGRRVYRQTHDTEPFAGEDENGDALADGLYYYTLETIDLDCSATPELRDYCTGTLQIMRQTE